MKLRKYKNGKRWYVRFNDHLGTRQELPASTDRRASEEFGRKLEKLAGLVAADDDLHELHPWIEALPVKIRDRLIEWGMLPTTTMAVAMALTEHIDAWHANMLALNRSDVHADQSRSRVLAVFNGCGFALWRDVKRHPIENWLAARRDDGMKMRTSNHHVAAVRAFCLWMVDHGLASKAPKIAKVTVTDEESRGAFTVAQIETLLTYCAKATDIWARGQREPRSTDRTSLPDQYLDGPGRGFVYRLAVETAMRAGTIRAITVGQVKIQTDTDGHVTGAEIRTVVGQQKNKKAHTVNLRASMANVVAQRIVGRDQSDHLVCLPRFQAAMLAEDLHGAGLPNVDEDDLPLRFHSFRHTTSTWMGEAGATAQEIQAVTGHLTRSMADKYTHTTRRAAKKAIELIPEVAMRTGTDDAEVTGDGGNVGEGLRISDGCSVSHTGNGFSRPARSAAPPPVRGSSYHQGGSPSPSTACDDSPWGKYGGRVSAPSSSVRVCRLEVAQLGDGWPKQTLMSRSV